MTVTAKTQAQLTEVLDAARQVNMHVLLRGEHGVGKLATLTDMAEAHGLHVETVPVHDADDLGTKPAWATRVIEGDQAFGQASVVVLAEFSVAPASVRDRYMNLMMTGTLPGGEKLPRDTWFVADCSTVGELPAQIDNRFMHVEYTPDLTEVKAKVAALLGR